MTYFYWGMLHNLAKSFPEEKKVLDQWVFVLDHRVFVLDQWVFVLDQWVFVLDHRVFGLRSSFLGLRFRHIRVPDGFTTHFEFQA